MSARGEWSLVGVKVFFPALAPTALEHLRRGNSLYLGSIEKLHPNQIGNSSVAWDRNARRNRFRHWLLPLPTAVLCAVGDVIVLFATHFGHCPVRKVFKGAQPAWVGNPCSSNFRVQIKSSKTDRTIFVQHQGGVHQSKTRRCMDSREPTCFRGPDRYLQK